MGLYGFPYSVSFGDHESMLKTMEVINVGGGCQVNCEAQYEQYYILNVDGVNQGLPLYGFADTPFQLRGVYGILPAGSKHIVCVCPLGDYTDPLIDVSPQAIDWQSARGDRITATVLTAPAFYTYGDSGQLSSWALTGVLRFSNCRPVPRRSTYGEIDVSLADTAGVRTVTLSLDGVTLASGSRTGDGSVTLTEQNSSGINGTVTVTYTADAADATLIADFPAQLAIHHRTSAFTAPDFPRTAEAKLLDDGYGDRFVYHSDPLAAGTYYVVPHQVDANANESAGLFGGGSIATVFVPPAAPGTPAYVSGGAAATVISFAASATGSATYNIYDSAETEILDVLTVSDTHIAGTGTIQHTLAAISGSFTGTRYVLVRAVFGGVEEGSLQVLTLDYVAGVVTPKQPPAPALSQPIITSGRTITVPVTIDTTRQKTAATHVRLFVFLDGASPTYGSPQASVTVGSSDEKVIAVSVPYTAGADGMYRFAIRTYSSVTLQESPNTETYGVVRLGTTAPPDPTVTVYTGA